MATKKRFYSGSKKAVRNQNGDMVERYPNNNGGSGRGWERAGTISVGRAGDMNARDYDGDYAGRGNDRFNTGRLYDGDYAGPLNVARRQEVKDFSMISEDRTKCANLPQEVRYHAWPKSIPYAEYHLDDTIRGIDSQERDDVMGMVKHVGGNKW